MRERPPLVRLRGAALSAVDGAVLWRLGLVRLAAGSTVAAPLDPAGFWRASAVSAPARVQARPWRGRDGDGLDIAGPSRGPGTHAGSRCFHGRAWLPRCGPEGTLVLLLHGYAAPGPLFEDWQARLLVRRGAGAARLELPYHLRRRPPGARAGDGFFSVDHEHSLGVFRQAVEDAAAVVCWAREQVAERVAVLGFSLGGLVACLLAATVELDSVVAVTPPCDLPEIILERGPARLRRLIGVTNGGGGPWGADAAGARVALEGALAPLIPRRLVPRTDPARITLVAATYDAIVGAPAVRRLGAAWGATVWEYAHSHISLLAARGLGARVREHVVEQALPRRATA